MSQPGFKTVQSRVQQTSIQQSGNNLTRNFKIIKEAEEIATEHTPLLSQTKYKITKIKNSPLPIGVQFLGENTRKGQGGLQLPCTSTLNPSLVTAPHSRQIENNRTYNCQKSSFLEVLLEGDKFWNCIRRASYKATAYYRKNNLY